MTYLKMIKDDNFINFLKCDYFNTKLQFIVIEVQRNINHFKRINMLGRLQLNMNDNSKSFGGVWGRTGIGTGGKKAKLKAQLLLKAP